MSGTREDALFTDPLDALRAADHRPLVEKWRDRITVGPPSSWVEHVRKGAVVLGLAALVVAIGWRLFVTSQPPIEDSLPIVQRTATEAPATAAQSAPSAPASSQVVAGSGAATNEVAVAQAQAVVVHVAGAVRSPGLVEGAEGWRVHDAIEAAGGLRPGADSDRINLAAHISDGQRIFVPTVGEPEPALVAGAVGQGTDGSPQGPIDVNTADATALQELVGIGPATAAAILSHRDEHGPFATVEALVAVRGIGPATLDAIRDHVVAS